MEKPNHYWKWYIGRFWYFDVLKASGENNLAFRCCAKSVGLFPATLDPAWKEPSDKPLSTTEHLKLIETYLYTPRYSHISPIHLRSCIRRKQRPTDSDGQQETLFSMYVGVNMELIHHYGKTLKGKIFFHLTLLRHQNIKTSQCTISKNGWVLPFFVNWTPVTNKLQLTVFMDHPVLVPLQKQINFLLYRWSLFVQN